MLKILAAMLRLSIAGFVSDIISVTKSSKMVKILIRLKIFNPNDLLGPLPVEKIKSLINSLKNAAMTLNLT